MKIFPASFCLAALLCAAPALAEPAATLQSDVAKLIGGAKEDHFLTFNVENDMFGGGQDSNYTSGVRMTYFRMGAPMPDFAYGIDKIIPTFTINKTTSVYWSLGQNLFTPKDITRVTQDPHDRPWAAFLYGSAGLATITANHVDSVEATLGVVGPAALGEETQKFVHKYISHSPEPMGWGNQLKNEPGLMLSWERSWPERYGFEALGWNASVVPHLGATVGNIYTYANTGLSLHLSPFAGRWQDDPVRVRPSMPGTGAFLVPPKTFVWYFFGGVETRAIARNIFLDGNTFTDSYSVNKKPFVLDLDAGAALTYGGVRLSYAYIWRTKEFDTQEAPSKFGTVSLGIRF